MAQAVALNPAGAAAHVSLGAVLRRMGDSNGAKPHFETSLQQPPSPASLNNFLWSSNPAVEAHVHLSFLETAPAERERNVRTAIMLEPKNYQVTHRLARLMDEQKNAAGADDAYRTLAELDPVQGGDRLYNHLRFSDRKLEAAVEFRRAQLRAREPSADASVPPPEPKQGLEEWKSYVDGIETRRHTFAPKCLERHCIEGLDAAIAQVEGGARAAELHAPHTAKAVLAMIRGMPAVGGSADCVDVDAGCSSWASAGECKNNAEFMLDMCKKACGVCIGESSSPVPTVLRAAGRGWGPNIRWDAAHLRSVAGEEELEVTVVTHAGNFEVHHDRIERPPKSVMRLGDFVRLLDTKLDTNLTIYSRQAPLWPMAGLLRDLAPGHEWMDVLRLSDLNFWLGDGHFRNTLHWDPYDNFLCQVRGRKHLLLYPPEAKESLYYAKRRDIQAHYSPTRGEYGRKDTGIVSENTASVNGANPDIATYPKFTEAIKVQSYASLEPSDCLYIPNGWHHHVFSEADASGGYNLALNLWVSRDATLGGMPPRPDYRVERFPTLRQVGAALHELEPHAAAKDEL